jgi:hypothetical protein
VEKPAQPQPEPQSPPATDDNPVAEGNDWVVPAMIFGISNLVLIGAGLGVWWFMRKRRRNDDGMSLQDDIESTAAADEQKTAKSSGESAEGGDTAREDRGEAA